MRKYCIAPALCFAVIGCGPSGIDQSNFDGTIEERASLTAAHLDAAMPIDAGGPQFVSARAEGRELVFEVHMQLSGLTTASPSYLTKILRPAACQGASGEFIQAGGVVRFDVSDPNMGTKLPSGRVANCTGY